MGGEATGSQVATWNPVMESHGNLGESHGKPDLFWCFFFPLIFFLLKNRETILCRFVVLCGLGGDFHAQLRQRESFASHWIALDHISFSQLET